MDLRSCDHWGEGRKTDTVDTELVMVVYTSRRIVTQVGRDQREARTAMPPVVRTTTRNLKYKQHAYPYICSLRRQEVTDNR